MLITVQDLKGLGYEKGKPVGLVGVTELSEAQKKQLKEQQEVMPWNDFQIHIVLQHGWVRWENEGGGSKETFPVAHK